MHLTQLILFNFFSGASSDTAIVISTITGGCGTVVLIFQDALVEIAHTAATTTDTIYLATEVNLTSAADKTLTLTHDGVKWYESGRTT